MVHIRCDFTFITEPLQRRGGELGADGFDCRGASSARGLDGGVERFAGGEGVEEASAEGVAGARGVDSAVVEAHSCDVGPGDSRRRWWRWWRWWRSFVQDAAPLAERDDDRRLDAVVQHPRRCGIKHLVVLVVVATACEMDLGERRRLVLVAHAVIHPAKQSVEPPREPGGYATERSASERVRRGTGAGRGAHVVGRDQYPPLDNLERPQVEQDAAARRLAQLNEPLDHPFKVARIAADETETGRQQLFPQLADVQPRRVDKQRPHRPLHPGAFRDDRTTRRLSVRLDDQVICTDPGLPNRPLIQLP